MGLRTGGTTTHVHGGGGMYAQGLGYTGNTSYNQFLYPTQGETRSMMRWIVGEIPKLTATATVEEDVATGAGGLSQRVIGALQGWRAELWTPPFLAKERTRLQRRLNTVRMEVPAVKRASKAKTKYVSCTDVCVSALECCSCIGCALCAVAGTTTTSCHS